jgi:hypothetical protein
MGKKKGGYRLRVIVDPLRKDSEKQRRSHGACMKKTR